MLRRIAVLASLAVMATMFAGISTAQAQTAGACVFEGLAGTLTPGIQDAVPDIQTAPIGPLDIEQGTYVFQSGGNAGAVCAGVFQGTPGVAPAVSIHSEGYYDNIICGTGFAHDLDGNKTTVTGANALPNGGTLSASGAGYEIAFAGGVGVLRIGPGGTPSLAGVAQDAYNALPLPTDWNDHTGGTGGTTDLTHGNISSPYTGAGVVQITPGTGPETAQSDNCIASSDGQTNAFQVKGAFVAAG